MIGLIIGPRTGVMTGPKNRYVMASTRGLGAHDWIFDRTHAETNGRNNKRTDNRTLCKANDRTNVMHHENTYNRIHERTDDRTQELMHEGTL